MSVRAWIHHAALNLGVALEALVYAVIPPETHHSPGQVQDLRGGSTGAWFRYGLGIGDRPTERDPRWPRT